MLRRPCGNASLALCCVFPGSPFPIGYWWVWVCLGMGWGIMSSAIITTLPLIESKDAIMQVRLFSKHSKVLIIVISRIG